jgi:tetratricopeptide (TPR) repeat protein
MQKYFVRGTFIACLLAALPAVARADDFQIHYDLAQALYNAQRFDDAIPELKAAYALEPKPSLLFNIAQAYRKSGHLREAIEYYDKYLTEDPQLDTDTRRKVDGYLIEARNTLAALELEMKRRLAEEKAAREPEPVGYSTQVALPPQHPVIFADPPQLTSQQPQKPVHRRWWFYTAIGSAVAVGLGVGVGVGVGVGIKSDPTPLATPVGVPRAVLVF